MKLSAEQIRHVARLARLALDDATVEAYRAQLSQVLDAFDVLAKVPDTIPAAQGAHDEGAPARPDEVRAELPASETFRNAPATQQGGFAIPKVIE